MTDPEMLLLDEPTAGATFEETRKLMSYIEDLRKDHGLTFLIVEHKMEVIMNLCDRIFVMNNGRKLTEGTPREVQRNPQVIEAYLGA
jgi:branched-chain amino acid transport system ATP-binding protein